MKHLSESTALNILLLFIKEGIEFPDAVYKASTASGYSIQELKQLYDEAQNA